MNKFNCIEDTKSEKSNSYDTILIIFQKKDTKNKETVYTLTNNYPKNDLSTRSSNAKRYYFFVNFAEVT